MFQVMNLRVKIDDCEGQSGLNVLYSSQVVNHDGDAGIDLYVPQTIVIPPKTMGYKINNFISCEATIDDNPVSYYLYARSSMGSRTPLRMSNSQGIIDSGYRGNIIGMVDNTTDKEYRIQQGDRLFQICSPTLNNPIKLEIVNTLSTSNRGEGGLGSTGN